MTAPATTSATATVSLTLARNLRGWSHAAQQRLQKPPRRGTFRKLDAARRQLGLLSVADEQGQARIYWLIDLDNQTVEDARFLAYGSLSSHPLCDAWCSLSMGLPVAEACSLSAAEIEASLRDEAHSPAFPADDASKLDFLTDLQRLALQAVPHLVLLPKPIEVERYVRKREQEWNDQDRAWLPLSLMKKLMWAQKEGSAALLDRTGRDIDWSVEGLHDDFRVIAQFKHVADDEIPLLLGFLSSGLQNRIHPQIKVEEASA